MSGDNFRNTQAPVPMTTALTVTGQAGYVDDAPRVLLAGADTVHMSFDVEVSDDMWSLLSQEKQKAIEIYEERKAVYAPEWLGGIMCTTGARGGYTFLIETDAFSVKLLKDITNRPPIFVEMRSLALHTHPGGALGACEEACRYLREVLLWDRDADKMAQWVNLDEAKCSRHGSAC